MQSLQGQECSLGQNMSADGQWLTIHVTGRRQDVLGNFVLYRFGPHSIQRLPIFLIKSSVITPSWKLVLFFFSFFFYQFCTIPIDNFSPLTYNTNFILPTGQKYWNLNFRHSNSSSITHFIPYQQISSKINHMIFSSTWLIAFLKMAGMNPKT